MKSSLSIKSFRLFILLVAISFTQVLQAQQPGVAINTDGSTAHTSALLDIKSTTKGILFPRMTTAQMFAINNPALGLIVFNNTYNQLYHYTSLGWKGILNSDFWNLPISGRNMIYNADDSIGIGVIPTSKLDVNGNARFRNALKVDEGLTTQTLTVTSNILSNGTALINSSIQTNSDLVINNESAILQMKVGATNKAFMQLDGNDLRIGTNVGNDNGNYVVRMNGISRLVIDPVGDITTTGNIQRPSKSGYRGLLPLAYGVVTRDGILVTNSSTSNVTVQRTSEGVYRITINESIQGIPTIVITPIWESYTSGGLNYTSGIHTIVSTELVEATSTSIKINVHASYVVPGDITEIYKLNTRFSFVIWTPDN